MHEMKNPLELLLNQDAPEEVHLNFEPQSFAEYLGQKELKHKLTIYTQAAKMRGEALDHMLLFGPPGLGKTTLATIMANVMGVGIKICTGPTLERTGDLVAILTTLEPRDILFIDEIHRMPTAVEEVLYSAMEQFKVDVIIGQGAGAQSINLPLHPFTLIGATTMVGKISAPLRSRFGIVERLDFYSAEELSAIIMQNAQFLGLPLCAESASQIAKSARGTPRTAKKLVRRVRDIAQVSYNNQTSLAIILEALKFLGIDEHGLCTVDNLILEKITLDFNGGPVGLETLAALIGEDKETIEQVYEPYLMRQGYLEKTARGRQIPHNKLPYLKSKFVGQKTLL